LLRPDETASAVLRVVLERALAGSRPGGREDEHLVCPAIEGGGMRGAVSAGMCLVLEAAGVVDAFDRIYGVSAGALNGWATAVGQAALSATHYEDAARRRVVNRMQALRGRPVFGFDLLFDEIIATRKPLSFERLTSSPELRILATSLETLKLRVLEGFADKDELLAAVRASASLPRLGGRPPVIGGERMADGGLRRPRKRSHGRSSGPSAGGDLRDRVQARTDESHWVGECETATTGSGLRRPRPDHPRFALLQQCVHWSAGNLGEALAPAGDAVEPPATTLATRACMLRRALICEVVAPRFGMGEDTSVVASPATLCTSSSGW
jgi:hypothetical protein